MSVEALRKPSRSGKAEAVRTGILAGIERGAALVGFLDADLSTPLRAIDDFLAVLRGRPSLEFILGSRVMLLGRDVQAEGDPALPGARVRHGRVSRARSARL